jgi:hypothetical protein
MKTRYKLLIGAGLLVGAAGWLTNGLPTIVANTFDSVVASAPQGIYTQALANGLVPVDTEIPSGVAPQTVAANLFQIGAIAFAEVVQNTTTSTVHAATLNTKAGYIITEALTTAAGATYTFTLTNSLFTTTSSQPLAVAMYNGTNTGGGGGQGMQLTSITMNSGSATLVFTNTGTTALNGTMTIIFHT